MLYRKKSNLLIFLLPTVLLIVTVIYIPFILNIFNSFYDMTGFLDNKTKFIGIDNYLNIFKDPSMKIVFFNTIKIMLSTIVFQVGIALALALLVYSIKFGSKFFRVVYFFPIVISATAIGLMFQLFYDYDNGMLNQILEVFNLDKVVWLSKDNAFTMISIPIVWQYVGFYFVILLTGISNISKDIYEAADIDGATKMQQIRLITIPLLKSTLNVCFILAITGSLKIFDLPWVLVPKGAPGGTTHFFGTYMYDVTFNSANVDYGATLSVILLIVGVIVSQISNKLFSVKE